MKILSLKCKTFAYACTEPLVADAATEPGQARFGSCLVLLVTVEPGDAPSKLRRAADAVLRISAATGVTQVVVNGFAHLSSRLAAPDDAACRVAALATELQERELAVHVTPFGWHKTLEFDVAADAHSHRFVHV